MATMYEVIMDLPLFKGVSKEQVSTFLEKTNVNFLNFEAGETIVSKGEAVTMVRFVISGEVRIIHSFDHCGIIVEELCGHGRVLGADRLYGLSIGYSCDVEAVAKTSIMEFSKEQYLRLLKSDHIYLLNFFNFLSRRAQRPVETLEGIGDAGLSSLISLLLGVLTDPDSRVITIKASVDELAGYCHLRDNDVKEWIERGEREGQIEYSDGGIRILSRDAFVK